MKANQAYLKSLQQVEPMHIYWLGLTVQNKEYAYSAPWAVLDVDKNSPADISGIKKGDVIYSFDVGHGNQVQIKNSTRFR